MSLSDVLCRWPTLLQVVYVSVLVLLRRRPCQDDILIRERVSIRDMSCYLLILYHIRFEQALTSIRPMYLRRNR